MTQPILILVAAGGEHPLIDLDGTLFVQLGLFFLMAFVATQWLFKPYLALRDDREEGIDGAKAQAEELDKKAAEALADYEAKLAASKAKAHEEQRQIRAEAGERKRQLTGEARARAAKALAQSTDRVTQEAAAARAELMPQAGAMAKEIATKLLGRKVA